MNNLSSFAQRLIEFQRQQELTDAQMAFESHFTVEQVHRFKAGELEPSAMELTRLNEYMASR